MAELPDELVINSNVASKENVLSFLLEIVCCSVGVDYGWDTLNPILPL